MIKLSLNWHNETWKLLLVKYSEMRSIHCLSGCSLRFNNDNFITENQEIPTREKKFWKKIVFI